MDAAPVAAPDTHGGAPAIHLVFTMTGANLSRGENARREAREQARSAPLWARKLKWLLILQHRMRRLAGGIYFQKPF